MSAPVHSTTEMIAGMNPELRPGRFVFCSVKSHESHENLIRQALATFHEVESLSLLLPFEVAKASELPTDLPMRQITLRVYSSLEGIGLTAAVATALAAKGIPCNVVSATLHDHVFVPEEMAQAALEALAQLQAVAASRPT